MSMLLDSIVYILYKNHIIKSEVPIHLFPLARNPDTYYSKANIKRGKEDGMRSPRISSMAWGNMTVEAVGTGKDFKLWPGGGRPWDWAETGTRHTPGIQPADIEELLTRGADVLVFGRGFDGRLDLSKAAARYLDARGVTYYFETTPAAVARYNQLATEGRAVGGLFHTTC